MPNQFTTSLWGDEAFSAVLSKASLLRIIDVSARDTYPPLYNIMEHLWFNLFGSSEIAIRFLSFLFFLLTIFFVYKIGALLWNKKIGLVAAALSFLNPFFFIYAFEGRMYSIMYPIQFRFKKKYIEAATPRAIMEYILPSKA